MTSLFDKLCVDNHYKFIKLTTVYPSFINTREIFTEMIGSGKEFTPQLEPKAVADEVVKGILFNIQDVT